jgi:transketolase
MLASQHKLNNLIVIIDNNGFQAMGRTKDIIDLEPLTEKWKAFGWNVAEIDGHDYLQIEKVLSLENKEKPLVIIAKTIKGKGVSFFENKLEWHYKNVDLENYQKALAELNNDNLSK